jgi:hypothetical protein
MDVIGQAITLAYHKTQQILHKSFIINGMHGEVIEPPMDHLDRYPDLLGSSVSTSYRVLGLFVRELGPLRLLFGRFCSNQNCRERQ